MPEYPLTINLKLSLVVDADDDSSLAQTVTDEVVNALQKVTVFSRAMVRPSSTFHHADGRPLRAGDPAAAAPTAARSTTASSAASSPTAASPTAAPASGPARDQRRVLGRDLAVTPVPGGQYEISLAGHGRICRAPSNHPEWLNVIADAINAGRQSA